MNDHIENEPVSEAEPAQVKESREINKVLLFRLLVSVVILITFVLFALGNLDQAQVTFLTWDFELSLFLVMVGSAVTGVIIWELAKFVDRRRKK